MLGYKTSRDQEDAGERAATDESAPSDAPPGDLGADGTRRASAQHPEAAEARRASRRRSTFAISEAIALDPAAVLDHEARHAQWADLFREALLSYRDVVIVAVIVSGDGDSIDHTNLRTSVNAPS